MLVVNGLYLGGDTVKIEKPDAPLPLSSKVLVTFSESTQDGEAEIAEKRAAFERLKKNRSATSFDFDVDKARWEALEEKYGPFA